MHESGARLLHVSERSPNSVAAQARNPCWALLSGKHFVFVRFLESF
jgi:hypothetical protein